LRVAAATPPTIEQLAARPAVLDASLSPDGRYIAIVRAQAGKAALVAFDRQARSNKVLMGEPEGFRFLGCSWVSDVRIVCSFLGFDSERDYVYSRTRLAAIDVDGQDLKMLAEGGAAIRGENLGNVVAWRTGKPETVLIQADSGTGDTTVAAVFGAQGSYAMPSVFELDTRRNQVRVLEQGRQPIRSWRADMRGEVRLAWGLSGTTETYYGRLAGEHEWRKLSRFEAFSADTGFQPVAISTSDPNKAYAFGTSRGRAAVWLIDLADKADPELIYSHDAVDVGAPLLDKDGALVGFRYDTDFPRVHYTDPLFASVAAATEALLPGQFVEVIDSTSDHFGFLVEAHSDRVAPSYYLYDRALAKLTAIGNPYPGIDPSSLAIMKPISYAARDGTVVTGYLTMPAGAPAGAGKVPLVVMPHGGPQARDYWDFDFLRHYLSTRGYAVLQMNFRGSDGFGYDWLHAAHQDWGGLTYDDVVDGTRWVITQGIADPARVQIVGWSFGGYVAELAAFRNPELFKCSVSIAGVSDLALLTDRYWGGVGYRTIRAQIGTDAAKLRRDSPRAHAGEFKVPLLMVHGDHDAQVEYEQSKLLDKALGGAGKARKFVTIKDGDHSLLHAESDRVTLLHEIDDFMKQSCPAG
jgi:dipeptidyl aminopeptidase/acylaminoacyl peptidase